MNNTFYTLSDDCMLMYEKNIFIVEKIKEHLLNGLNQKMQFLFDGGSRNSYHKSFFHQLNSKYNIDNKFSFEINQSSWNTISEEIDCQLLKLGAASWKSGKLRFKAIANYNNLSEPQLTIEIELEFCPDEPEPLETSDSALDELRQQLQIYK
ncbi:MULTISPECIES: KGK domain-containing protein [Planktothrix]|uniref:KGK domain-containing protein n=1 Tax=Planktothrix TaxID=54304 RepID=UPI0009DC3254|nr:MULTISPECIES: KGK domain-containing protein [Planktothrix]CAD0232122.1 putative KGK family protein [Planktothrix agardhii]CAD5946695.1 Putative KGK family protein [Planktothrix agardhii]